jgi:hypothetical protein
MTKFDPANPVTSFKLVLIELIRGYEFDVEGLYLKSGAVRPLPKEAAVVGKVLEVSIHEYLSRRLLAVSRLKVIPASSDRVYPDLTFDGPLIYPHRFALDVKCARRAESGVGTTSAITIGTFDAEYFHNPDHKAGNIMMPYSSYTAHLALIALYDYENATARNIELLVVEKWRVATRKRSSGTRCYIAAAKSIDALRREQGDFNTEEAFNAFWRSQAIGEGKEQKWKDRRDSGLT